jgi:hypothetical protein
MVREVGNDGGMSGGDGDGEKRVRRIVGKRGNDGERGWK